MRELLIGCGNRKKKELYPRGQTLWNDLTTLDIDPRCEPDIVHNLENIPLPFEDGSFSEIHAYEVLEHVGRQGDYKFFLAQFQDFWRILHPFGCLCGSVPAPGSPWVWADPGHTRAIPPETFTFLDQRAYGQLGNTAMSDYREIYHGDFEPILMEVSGDRFFFVLKAHKPIRQL